MTRGPAFGRARDVRASQPVALLLVSPSCASPGVALLQSVPRCAEWVATDALLGRRTVVFLGISTCHAMACALLRRPR
jgi:hypothetical protein